MSHSVNMMPIMACHIIF
ncbi:MULTISPECIES: CRISPR-associated DxTHG motif protein [unclassified Niallia]